MLYTVIDVGSNSIRMTIFRHENNQLTMLINKKSTAGLASYVSEGVMDELGVQKCCDEVQSFVNLSRNLDSTNISIIATASLRNLVNLDSVQKALENAVGMRAEVLTGQEEARLDYVGVTHHLSQQSGVIVDIGGASTELVKFDSSGIQSLVSLPVGSLSLYNEYSSDLFPTAKDRKAMKTRVEQELAQIQWPLPEAPVTLCGVGGTARAFFKICREFYGIPKPQREVDAGYISLVNKKLKSRDFRVQQGVYRATPDRVFAIMPGMLILNQVSKKFLADRFALSQAGIREGYILDRILHC